MHSALRHDEKKFVDVPVFLTALTIAITAFVIAGLTQKQFMLLGLVIRVRGLDAIGLRRGIVAYRKFG